MKGGPQILGTWSLWNWQIGWLPVRLLVSLEVSSFSAQSWTICKFLISLSRALSLITYFFPCNWLPFCPEFLLKNTFASENSKCYSTWLLFPTSTCSRAGAYGCWWTLTVAEHAIHMTPLEWCSVQPEQPYPVVLPGSLILHPLFVWLFLNCICSYFHYDIWDRLADDCHSCSSSQCKGKCSDFYFKQNVAWNSGSATY